MAFCRSRTSSFIPKGAAVNALTPVRFPFRAERLFDDPNGIMADDVQRLALSEDLIDVAIAEVKTNQPCILNGPWTRRDRQNVHRVLAAIGCLPPDLIEKAAADIYRTGFHRGDIRLRIRLVAVGRDRSEDLAAAYPDVSQLIWAEILGLGLLSKGRTKPIRSG